MNLSAFYYLSYPDSNPLDALVASSEVYVEVSEGEGDVNQFDDTYSIFVHTVGYLRTKVAAGDYYLTGPALIVERFDDASIKAALTALLPQIARIAVKK